MNIGKHDKSFDELSFGLGSIRTPEPVKHDHEDFFSFLNIMDKLMDDIRGLNTTIAKERKKVDQLTKENCDLKVEVIKLSRPNNLNQQLPNASNNPSSSNESPNTAESENDKDKQEDTAVGFAQQWALSVDERKKKYEKYKIEQNATKAMFQVQKNHSNKARKDNDLIENSSNSGSKSNKNRKTNSTVTSKQTKQNTDANEEQLTTRSGENNKNLAPKSDPSLADTTAQAHAWNHGCTLIAGDSILNGIDERKLSKRRNVKVRNFPGATTADMKDYLKPLLRKKPTNVILHVGTNDSVNHDAGTIINDLLDLKQSIEK